MPVNEQRPRYKGKISSNKLMGGLHEFIDAAMALTMALR